MQSDASQGALVRKTLLVTGGAGFIGANFIHYTQTHYPDARVINLDLLTYAGSLENLRSLPRPDHYEFIQGDICDQKLAEDILRGKGVDTIVHFAAESHVDRSILGPQAFVQTNIFGTFALLEASRQVWLTEQAQPIDRVRFHHISTDEVYGTLGPDDPAFEESTPYAPNSPYAASKAASDHLARAYLHTYGLPVTISNCSNNYGPYQFPEKLIPLMITNALAGKPLPIYGDGRQIRDWLYVEDHCQAIWEIIKEGKVGECYNIGGGNQPANLEIVKTLCAILDRQMPDSPFKPHEQLIAYVQDRPGHDRRYAMNISKIRAQLGWQPRHTLEEGLEKTVSWYMANLEWLDAIREQGDYRKWLDDNYQKRGTR